MEENGHVTEVVSLMEGELSCYRGGHCKGRRIVMLQFNGGENDVTEVASLMEGEWSCYRGGQFNGEIMVILRKRQV